MNILPTIQSKYTTVNTVNTTTQDTSTYDEVAKKKQPTRYELLLSMNYDNMSEAERSELSHYNAMRPMPFLDEEGNKALNKALEGKTDAEKFSIKNMLQLEFTTSIKVNHSNRTIDREKFDSIDTSRSATVDRFENFMEDFHKNGSVDEIGLMDVMNKFLNIYKASDSSYDIKNQKDSVVDNFLEDLYSKKSSNLKSAIAKDEIENKVDEYAQLMMEENGDAPESELDASKILSEYKIELLQEYKDTLESAKNDKITQQQEAIIKILLDENKKETSSLEKLLASKTDSVSVDESTKSEVNYYMQNLDEKGNEIVNNLLSGRTETEKFAIKGILDRQLNFKHTEAYAMAVDAFNEYNKSDIGVSIQQNGFKNKEILLDNLDEFIERQSNGIDNLGILEIAKQLRNEYM